MTDSKKNRFLPEKKYLFVLLATKSCQLKFEDLVLYSFLVYRAGTKHPSVSLRRIADNLGFCRPAVRESLNRLKTFVLVSKTDKGRWFAVEPKDKWDWFVTIKKVNVAEWDWNKRFASFPIYIPRPKRMLPPGSRRTSTEAAGAVEPANQSPPVGGYGEQPGQSPLPAASGKPADQSPPPGANGDQADQSPPPGANGDQASQSPLPAANGKQITGTKEAECLTPRENAVLWKIHSWNTGRVFMTITHQGIATQLRLKREAVCRAIKSLKAKKLLDDDLQATIKDDQHRYWLDAPKKVRRNPKAQASRSLAELVTGWYKSTGAKKPYYFLATKGLADTLNADEQAMRNAGYNSADIRHYWEAVAFKFCKAEWRYLECFLLKGFDMVFRVTEQIHDVKGAAYRNSLGLLKRKTEGAIRSIQRRYEGRSHADYDPLLDWEPDYGEVRWDEKK